MRWSRHAPSPPSFPLLLAGATSVADPLKLTKVSNPQELLYTLLAVSHAPQPELMLSGAVGWEDWSEWVGRRAHAKLRSPCSAGPACPLQTPHLCVHSPSPCAAPAAVNAAGFIYVQDVDLAKGTLTVLSPCAGPLPSGLLLAGSFKTYLE